MIKVITIIGARPQIIKAAAISRAIKTKYSDKIKEIIVHTGQHYDENMSNVFFNELGIPRPDYNLSVGSGSHGKQTAKMLEGIEEIILKENPQGVIVYGDTNSTLAGGVAASKLHIPLIHIEAGLRSFNKKMPEEVNRIICDHTSTLLFSPTKTGLDNLKREGFAIDNDAPYNMNNPKVYHCGDIMYDNSLYFSELSDKDSNILEKLALEKENFILSTIHRNSNTDVPEKLTSIFKALLEIVRLSDKKLVLPLHPRTKKLLEINVEKSILDQVLSNDKFVITDPVSFLDIIALEKNSTMIVTDSGGVQKEAFFFKKPCIILRPETEWIELVENGNAVIADTDENIILDAYKDFASNDSLTYPEVYGDGSAAEFICGEIVEHVG